MLAIVSVHALPSQVLITSTTKAIIPIGSGQEAQPKTAQEMYTPKKSSRFGHEFQSTPVKSANLSKGEDSDDDMKPPEGEGAPSL